MAEVPVATRRRGRPRVGSGSSRIAVRVPDEVIDELCRRALCDGVSLARVVREALVVAVQKERPARNLS